MNADIMIVDMQKKSQLLIDIRIGKLIQAHTFLECQVEIPTATATQKSAQTLLESWVGTNLA